MDETHKSNLDTRRREITPLIDKRNKDVTLQNQASIKAVSYCRPTPQ